VRIGDRFDGYLIDLDGTVWVGDRGVPGAPEALDALRRAGKELVFVTNDSRTSADRLAARLREIGIAAQPDDVLTAGEVTARLAAESCGGGGDAFVIGSPALHRQVAEAGLRVANGGNGAGADVVVVALHTEFSYAELRTATLALAGGAKLFATNREPGLPMPDGTWPGTGAIVAAVEYASGATATIGGKPERHLFDRARRRLGAVSRVAMVGDGLASDVAGAAGAGLATILVLTGNASRQQVEGADPQPDHVIDSIAELA
jgi:HAD superfamily hydrolase (TIGR01450 family)